jgi:hypothetical protein
MESFKMKYLTPEKTMDLKKVYKGFGNVFKNKFASFFRKSTNIAIGIDKKNTGDSSPKKLVRMDTKDARRHLSK